MLLRAKRASVRPYDLRISRDHGGGLWTMESSTGQLYLAVLSPRTAAFKRAREEQRRAAGR